MVDKCIICSDTKAQKVAETFPSYKVYVCSNCQFGIVDPLPTETQLDELYNSTEYFTENMDYNFDSISQDKIDRIVQMHKNMHEEFVRKYLSAGQYILEIGSGGGFALQAFKEMGLNVMGVETSAVAQRFAVDTLKVEVVKSSLEDFKTEKKFDVVFLNHVLEHFMDPNEAMRKITSLLNKGGFLYVRVPDHDSYDRRAFKEKWPAYAYFHISNFSEKSLKALYHKNNLEVVEVKKYISEKVNGWLRKIIRFLPLQSYWKNKFSGRTITIIGKKK
ncbi:MAG: hypothetical protein JWO58_499 [Chitinophagaceae bacterium]|nr:hypothetical protein [Chitinophagaceae bacterium]